MSTSRDDTATLILALLCILALLAGGVLFVGRKAASFRAMAVAQQAQALEMEARVRAEAARAEEESQRAASGLPDDAIASGDPSKPGDQRVALREALDQAAAKLETSPPPDPAATASLHSALGQSYFGLGDLDAAEKHFTAALVLHVKSGGEDSPDAATDRDNLAKVAAARAK